MTTEDTQDTDVDLYKAAEPQKEALSAKGSVLPLTVDQASFDLRAVETDLAHLVWHAVISNCAAVQAASGTELRKHLLATRCGHVQKEVIPPLTAHDRRRAEDEKRAHAARYPSLERWTDMETVTDQPNEDREAESPVLLVSLGEASALTLGQGRGSSEDKRRAYN
ncbi:albusnodin family lasso peptide [Nocardiopsis alba]|uniref:albusnodin family lasso peptide n=1 Tax=Nocardiopsis alba TaxID=53437 RepID=UPI00380EBB22